MGVAGPQAVLDEADAEHRQEVGRKALPEVKHAVPGANQVMSQSHERSSVREARVRGVAGRRNEKAPDFSRA